MTQIPNAFEANTKVDFDTFVSYDQIAKMSREDQLNYWSGRFMLRIGRGDALKDVLSTMENSVYTIGFEAGEGFANELATDQKRHEARMARNEKRSKVRKTKVSIKRKGKTKRSKK